MLKCLNSEPKLAAIQVRNTTIVVIVSGPQYGSVFLLNLFLASVKQNFCALLNFGFFGIVCNQMVKASNSLFEFLAVHQLESSLVRLDGIREVLRSYAFRWSRS